MNRLYQILDNYEPIPETGCWIWMGATNGVGYGQASILGKRQLVHRLAYLAKTGEMPVGKVVMHNCDNPLCINPDHLSVGTQKDNLDDMMRKGRNNPPKSLLAVEQFTEIKSSKERGNYLAKKYGVSQSYICNIRAGRAG